MFRLALTELRRLTSGRLPKLALAAVTLVPLLYGAIYLYANWDPYGRLDSVPAAVVIDDRGATRSDDSELRAGEKVYEQLEESGSFDWQRTSRDDADRGVADGRYTFALVVPKDFSPALLSPGEFEPRQAQLQLITNDSNNYLAGTMADQVAAQVRQAVAKDAGSEAADQLLLGFATVHDKTMEAADGAGRLRDGAGELRDGLDSAQQGAHRLSSGAHELVNGQRSLTDATGQLVDGTDRLAGGVGRLDNGLGELRDRTAELPDQTAKLADGSQRVADGARQVADGNQQLADKAGKIGDLSRQLTTDLTGNQQRVLDQLREAGVDEDTVRRVQQELDTLGEPITEANAELQEKVGQVRTLADGSQRVADGARQVADGNQQLAEATPAMTTAIGQLADGAGELSSGAGGLRDGSVQLNDGQRQALDGAQALADGSDELVSGAGKLFNGSGELTDGAGTLANRLDEGAQDVPNPDDATRTETADTIGDPVAVDTRAQVDAGTYGAGLAPFFMGLALWIGGFVLFLLIRPLSQRALAAGVPAWRIAVGGWLPAAIVGIAQAVLLYVAVVFGVGVQPAHPLLTLAFLLLTSFAFTGVVHALNAAFGPKGKFLALLILVLQLVTSGGTFPWQTIPDALHPLHRILPMSYVVDGLRHLLYGGPGLETAGRAALVLLCYFAAGLLLSTVAAARKRIWTPARVRPELAL